jgi:hypothetical protein
MSKSACSDCDIAREHPGYSFYTPACAFCGARLIKRIQALAKPTDEKSERCKKVLLDWVSYGHSELQIRAMVKSKVTPLAEIEKPTEVKKK